MKTKYKELKYDLSEAVKKRRTVYSRRLNGYKVEIIQNYFQSKNIPGKVVHEPFKNFCHNRNFALQSCVGMSDFVILLDADMILDVKTFDKNMLKKAKFYLILCFFASCNSSEYFPRAVSSPLFIAVLYISESFL